jgi:hypothetical protein
MRRPDRRAARSSLRSDGGRVGSGTGPRRARRTAGVGIQQTSFWAETPPFGTVRTRGVRRTDRVRARGCPFGRGRRRPVRVSRDGIGALEGVVKARGGRKEQGPTVDQGHELGKVHVRQMGTAGSSGGRKTGCSTNMIVSLALPVPSLRVWRPAAPSNNEGSIRRRSMPAGHAVAEGVGGPGERLIVARAA